MYLIRLQLTNIENISATLVAINTSEMQGRKAEAGREKEKGVKQKDIYMEKNTERKLKRKKLKNT